MAERRKRKSKKKGLQRAALMDVHADPGVGQPTANVTMNVIKMENCKEIHIGNKNISMALAENTSEEQHFDLDEDLVITYQSVRSSTRHDSEEVSIQALETTFISRHKSSKKITSFRDIGKQKLLKYLRAKGELYILKRQDDHWNVKPTPQAIEKYSACKVSESITNEAEKIDRHSTSNSEATYSSSPTVNVMTNEEKPSTELQLQQLIHQPKILQKVQYPKELVLKGNFSQHLLKDVNMTQR